jgi:hypothetical protein
MRQRELHLKRRERAADAIHHEQQRYRVVTSTMIALVFSLLVLGLVALVAQLDPGPTRWKLAAPALAIGSFVGVLLGQGIWDTARGRRLLAREESRLRHKYSGDLHSGRRWLPFYYQGEDISAYVPQILYFIDSEKRFDSVDAALAFARQSRYESDAFAARALALFESVAAQTNGMVVSSTDATGRPSSRIMRFVRSERPGVWFVTTAPTGPKVKELELGRVALVTTPTESGATISSNRVVVERAGVPFAAVAGLYREQVPGYADGMSEAEQELELVYELRLLSAQVETWVARDVVVFEEIGEGHAEPSTNLD